MFIYLFIYEPFDYQTSALTQARPFGAKVVSHHICDPTT
jgi:hypothetical protein